MKILIRPSYPQFDIARFTALVDRLQRSTYKIGAKYEEAPHFTDCITAVRYILEHSTDLVLPKVYIWDFPWFLLRDFWAREVSVELWKIGDLIFFEKMSFRHEKYMIAHVGILISETEFFHSSLHFDGGNISSVQDIDYNALILDESFLDIAKDPRNNH